MKTALILASILLFGMECDFHIHTIFLDEVIWPTVRIDEEIIK